MRISKKALASQLTLFTVGSSLIALGFDLIKDDVIPTGSTLIVLGIVLITIFLYMQYREQEGIVK